MLPEEKTELLQIAETFKASVIDYGRGQLLLEFVQTATKNDAVVKLMKEEFKNIEVVRGGSVGIESIEHDGTISAGRICRFIVPARYFETKNRVHS